MDPGDRRHHRGIYKEVRQKRFMNSREKGKRGEIQLGHILEGYGYNTRRGQQFSGANGDADVVGLPGIHIECKRVEKLNIDKALQQSIRDCYADELRQGIDLIPAVFHRSNDDRKKDSTKGVWKVTLRLKDFMELYKEWEVHQIPFKGSEDENEKD